MSTILAIVAGWVIVNLLLVCVALPRWARRKSRLRWGGRPQDAESAASSATAPPKRVYYPKVCSTKA